MPLFYQGVPIRSSYATCSIGHKPEHDLPSKLEAISAAGFEAIELSMPDITSYAAKLNGKTPDAKDFDTLVQVGQEIRKLVQKHNLSILMLQPFANFEGWIKGKHDKEIEDAWDRARGWMRIMEAVGTDMLQVSSPFSQNLTNIYGFVFNIENDRLVRLILRTSPPHPKTVHQIWQH